MSGRAVEVADGRARRTAALWAALLVGVLMVAALGVAPAAGASESPVFHEGVAPRPFGGPTGARYPSNVGGTYVPVPMRCGTESRVLWYAPGAAADTLWRNLTFPTFGNVGHTDVPVTIAGTFQPVVGDLDGDACDDILWYAPGATADAVWYFAPDGSHVSMPLTIDGTYTPVVGDFDSNPATDEVFWYGPGSVTESIWVAQPAGPSVVRGTFLGRTAPQVSGTFTPVANYDNRGILWYAPGAAQDYLWQAVTAGSTTAASAPTTVGGTYTARSVAGMPLLWTPGAGADRLVTATPFTLDHVDLVTVPAELDPVSAIATTTRRTGFTVLHEPGAGTDWFLVPRARASATDFAVSPSTTGTVGTSCAVVGVSGLVQCWGNDYGVGGTDTAAPRTVAGISGATQVSVARDFGCARRNDGRVLCWGANGYGQLGRGAVSPSDPVAALVTGVTGAAEVRVGNEYACARITGAVKCWGRNEFGQLGNGSSVASSPTPVAVTGVPAYDTVDITEVTAGPQHACMIAKGEAFCWGKGSSGQLGNGTTTSVQRSAVLATKCLSAICIKTIYRQITAGDFHTCALANDVPNCWGSDTGGQLGNGPGPVSATRPAPVVGIPDSTGYEVMSMSAGYDRTCGILRNGQMWCWGSNANGTLGTGGALASGIAPTIVGTTSSGWTSVRVGGYHTCAGAGIGQVYCWGKGGAGQLGQFGPTGFADLVDRSTPRLVTYYGFFVTLVPLP